MTGRETSRPDLASLLADLQEEGKVLRRILGGLASSDWEKTTPAEGWTIHDQVTHLMYFDQSATLAVSDPDTFVSQAAELMASGTDFADRVASELRSMPHDAALSGWVGARERLIEVYSIQDGRRRVPWYGPEMSIMSAATARLMETWAHGVDVADALHLPVKATNRLRHVAHLGFATMDFSFANRGLDVPTVPVRVELGASDGGLWSFGPEIAADRVSGTALDFCLVVTQRRSLGKTELVVTGPTATDWMSIAQAFAGPPTSRQGPD